MKQLEAFTPSSKGSHGRYSVCKRCKSEQARIRYTNDQSLRARKKELDNTPERREYFKEMARRRRNDPEKRMKMDEYMIEYRKTYDWRAQRDEAMSDPVRLAKIRESQRKSYSNMKSNPDRLSRNKQWLDAYRKTDGYRQYKRENYRKRVNKQEASFFIVLSLRNRMNKVLSGHVKAGRSIDLLGCSLDAFKEHISSLFTDGMTWENRGKKGWHLDHIVPCAFFDMSILENQRICFHYLNIQPLWARDNCSKQDNIPENTYDVIQKIRAAISDDPHL